MTFCDRLQRWYRPVPNGLYADDLARHQRGYTDYYGAVPRRGQPVWSIGQIEHWVDRVPDYDPRRRTRRVRKGTGYGYTREGIERWNNGVW
jgi:hypothetical protein